VHEAPAEPFQIEALVSRAACLFIEHAYDRRLYAITSMTSDVEPVIDELFAANRILVGEGVIDGFGHASVRNPQQLTGA
jgi:hypothetical protein